MLINQFVVLWRNHGGDEKKRRKRDRREQNNEFQLKFTLNRDFHGKSDSQAKKSKQRSIHDLSMPSQPPAPHRTSSP
jgi:hypothetical protein